MNSQIHFSWRTRDIEGDQFRQSKSSSKPDAVPPRDKAGSARYAKHLPFQVFCCESGTHVVDPAQSYYQGIVYHAGTDYHNLSSSDTAPTREPDASCLDSSQAWFCRDLWVNKAGEGMKEAEPVDAVQRRKKREVKVEETEIDGVARRDAEEVDYDANAGSDYDAMPDSDVPLAEAPAARLSIPNSLFRPARILVNPRCVTTYAGVSHTQLALDLFGPEREDDGGEGVGKYTLEDWDGAPESFVCQEQLYVDLLSFDWQVNLTFIDIVGKLVDERPPKHSGGLDFRFMMRWTVLLLLHLDGQLVRWRFHPTLTCSLRAKHERSWDC